MTRTSVASRHFVPSGYREAGEDRVTGPCRPMQARMFHAARRHRPPNLPARQGRLTGEGCTRARAPNPKPRAPTNPSGPP